jgi:hypothetical protein
MMALKFLHRWLMLRLAPATLALALLAAPLTASFDEVGAGARAAGMADAQTALADDANAAVHNPAGLVQIVQPQLTAEFGEYARGLTDGSKLGSTYLGYAYPWTIGDTVIGFAYRDFKATTIVQERTMLVGAGRRLKHQLFGWEGVWSYGANVKMLNREFVTDGFATNAIGDSGSASGRADPVLSGGAESKAFALDMGLMYQFGRRLESSFGLMGMNVNRPNIAIQSGDRAPEIVKIGFAHRPKWGAMTAEMRRARRLAGEPDTDLALGVERHFRLQGPNAVSVRAGYAEGSRGYKAVTAGAAYHFGRFSLDYALSFPIGHLSDTDGHQRFGFSMKFGSTATARAPVETVIVSTPVITITVPETPTPLAPKVEAAPAVPAVVPVPVAPVMVPVPVPMPVAPVVAPMPVPVPAVVPQPAVPAPVAPAAAPVVKPAAEPVPAAAPKPAKAPVAKPATKPAGKPAATPVAKPAAPVLPALKPANQPAGRPEVRPKPAATGAVRNPAAERAWQFYEEAVRREVADHEKIELLESMLMQFGEQEAARINQELEKLRRRAGKKPKGTGSR